MLWRPPIWHWPRRFLAGGSASTLGAWAHYLRTIAYSGSRSTVCEPDTLSDLDNVSVGIADVAARLAGLGDRLGDELRSSTSPQFIARLNICNADIHKAADLIRVGEDAKCYRRFV